MESNISWMQAQQQSSHPSPSQEIFRNIPDRPLNHEDSPLSHRSSMRAGRVGSTMSRQRSNRQSRKLTTNYSTPISTTKVSRKNTFSGRIDLMAGLWITVKPRYNNTPRGRYTEFKVEGVVISSFFQEKHIFFVLTLFSSHIIFFVFYL
jgi:hypothetical protein